MFVRRAFQVIVVLAVALAGAVTGSGAAQAEDSGATGAKAAHERQLLFYNHAYGVFDRETADAVEHSEYLKRFANFQVRTTTGSDGQTWTGRYLLGRETYLEIFGVGDLPGQDGTLGAAGMGVSTEHDGDFETVLDRLRALGVSDPVLFQQTRDFGDGVPVPWFDSVFTSDVYDAFGVWAMEYRQEYLTDPRATVEPPRYPGDVGREPYLPDDYRDKMMRDITDVRIAVTARDLGNTEPMLRAGGFTVRKTTDGGLLATRGGTALRFEVAPRDQVGMREVTMRLNRPVKRQHTERLGNSTLVVGPGARAVWTFDAR